MLFSDKFDAHDVLEDVKALRKILFTAPLQVPNETIVSHSKYNKYNAKILGLNVSDNLKWNVHIAELVKKASSCLFSLKTTQTLGCCP